VQILATEHLGLLATRNPTWIEIFSRVTMFIAPLCADAGPFSSLELVDQPGAGARP
jgi:hypothetical protein